MSKLRVAVVGYGNIGKYAIEALRVADDMEIAGVVRRNASVVPDEIKDLKVVSNIDELGKVDVAILATPTRDVPATASAMLAKGICTVDSFDIHGGIWDLRQQLGEIARRTALQLSSLQDGIQVQTQ